MRAIVVAAAMFIMCCDTDRQHDGQRNDRCYAACMADEGTGGYRYVNGRCFCHHWLPGQEGWYGHWREATEMAQ